VSHRPILYCTHRPGPPLDRFIEQLWYWEGVPPAHAKDRLMPRGLCGLMINLAEDETRLYHGPGDDIVWRPFSIASPVAGERLAFQLTRVPGGTFNGLFEALAPGDAIRLDRRAFGFLTLAQLAPGGTLWLIATTRSPSEQRSSTT